MEDIIWTGDTVKVKGEDSGLWVVNNAGTLPKVLIIQNGNMASGRMEDRDNLILEQKARTEDDELGPRLIPERNILG